MGARQNGHAYKISDSVNKHESIGSRVRSAIGATEP
jgi:hypothetical protein